MTEYRVTWEIDVDGSSPYAAARFANRIMKAQGDPVFTVTERTTGKTVTVVDLADELDQSILDKTTMNDEDTMPDAHTCTRHCGSGYHPDAVTVRLIENYEKDHP